jgi:predicted transposase YbfD/YdcC
MATKEWSKLVEAVEAVPDPRRQCRNLRHRLVDVLTIGFSGVLCGCDDYVESEEFARSKEDLFRRFLELPNGIPSHDTFRRVFQAVCPLALQHCLIDWLKGLRQTAPAAAGAGEVVAIDGKTLRRTFDRARELGALHLVSAWATANGIAVGQIAVDAKSNEITAIPQLIELLDLKDCVVTIDAAGCRKEIAAKIGAKDADYVLALKDNQPKLHEQVAAYFLEQLEADNPDGKMRRHCEVEKGHGRTERRETFVAPAPKEMIATGTWVGLASIVLVIRHCIDHATGKTTDEVRYFISSLPAKAKRLAGADRNGIENLALLNRLAVSLLRQDKTVKAGVKCKRQTAGWDNDYLLHLLFDSP